MLTKCRMVVNVVTFGTCQSSTMTTSLCYSRVASQSIVASTKQRQLLLDNIADIKPRQKHAVENGAAWRRPWRPRMSARGCQQGALGWWCLAWMMRA